MASRRDAIVRVAEPMHIFARSARRSERERERAREKEEEETGEGNVTFRAPIGSFIRVAGARVVLYNDCITRIGSGQTCCLRCNYFTLRNAIVYRRVRAPFEERRFDV